MRLALHRNPKVRSETPNQQYRSLTTHTSYRLTHVKSILRKPAAFIRRIPSFVLLVNAVIIGVASLPTCLLGMLYLGHEELTPSIAWELFFTRFYALPLVFLPYMVGFTLINLFLFRKIIGRPLKSAMGMSLLDFAGVAIIYTVSVLAFAPWEYMCTPH